MPSYNDLFGDPVDVLHPAIRVYAVDDNEDLPLRHISISVTPGEGIMELPRGQKGEPGQKGDPATPFLHMGDRSASHISALQLGPDDAGKAYRNTDTNDMHYWSGSYWVVFQDAFGAQGPVGPPGAITAVSIEHLDKNDDPVASITGSPGNQVLHLGIPAVPGPKGDTGPSAAIESAADYDDAANPADGAVLTYNGTTGLWYPGAGPQVRHYSLPSGAFSNTGAQLTSSHQLLAELPLDPLPFPTAVYITGHFMMNQFNTSQMAIEARVGGTGAASDGTTVAKGIALPGIGDQFITLTPHFSTSASPNTSTAPGGYVGIIPANHTGNAGKIYVVVSRVGGIGAWEVKASHAQLSVLRHPA
ncbi:minor tail protein [Gordonia phage OneUp]|uniref:Minor tail protein n=1 Tax=Gordonia phage OneUp TaxID=1838074 RepID=A0A160DHD4_9CAUD|nr:minor tail protein [Gordonia phage OneUp]ANA86384.1 minor tail protein [Gordonia phage OneUp]